MRKLRMAGLVMGLAFVWTVSSGCTSRDEYLRESFARRKAVERADALERELADERNRVLALESERGSLQRELDSKSALAETLQGENQRLDAFAQRLQSQIDEMLAKGVGDIQVVEVKLPPELDKALQEFAAQYPDQVEYDSERGVVRWKSDLTFALGSDVVRDSAKAALQAFARIVNSPAAGEFDVVVTGHTDNVPIRSTTSQKHPTNWHLSVHRAVAVAFVLNQMGLSFDRIGCMGYGEFRPIVANPVRGGAEANRRVEIFLVGKRDVNYSSPPSRETISTNRSMADTMDNQ